MSVNNVYTVDYLNNYLKLFMCLIFIYYQKWWYLEPMITLVVKLKHCAFDYLWNSRIMQSYQQMYQKYTNINFLFLWIL